MATERLWLTEPRRATALAQVVAVRGHAFALDRSLFAPASKAHRHPQPADKGTVWLDGEKRRLERVHLRDGVLWHELRGTTPKTGTKVQCHLDADRRLAASRAHTALHLLLAALYPPSSAVPVPDEGAATPPMTRDPEVKGGGSFRLDLAAPLPPRQLAAALAQARQWVEQDRRVAAEHVLREHAPKMLAPQRFRPPDPFPGPADVLDVVRIDGVAAFPCDGTHVERTGKVGPLSIAQAHGSGRGGYTVIGRVG